MKKLSVIEEQQLASKDEIIIDDEVYAFGASLKDVGRKLFAYIKMNETSAADLLSRIR